MNVPYWESGSDVTTTCPHCERRVRRRLNETLFGHNTGPRLGSPCPGSGQRPVITVAPVMAVAVGGS